MSKTPIVFDEDDVIDVEAAPEIDVDTTAMGVILTSTTSRVGWLGRIFITAATALLGLTIWTYSWNFLTRLLNENPILGQVAIGLFALVILVSVLYIMREIWAVLRLRRVDRFRDDALDIRNTGGLDAARHYAQRLGRFYHSNANIDHAKFDRDVAALSDADALLDYSEHGLLQPLDQLARREIERRARQVAVVTAFVPLALADLIVVLNANVGMIRSIADIYGGRPGWFGGWRLLRRVIAHLVATGAVAVGDDVIGSVLGGNIVGKLSRRFGEGIVNGALTARVGIAAIEVCRPMVFHAEKEPTVRGLIGRALTDFGARRAASPET